VRLDLDPHIYITLPDGTGVVETLEILVWEAEEMVRTFKPEIKRDLPLP
jgi:hypothetical protein